MERRLHGQAPFGTTTRNNTGNRLHELDAEEQWHYFLTAR